MSCSVLRTIIYSILVSCSCPAGCPAVSCFVLRIIIDSTLVSCSCPADCPAVSGRGLRTIIYIILVSCSCPAGWPAVSCSVLLWQRHVVGQCGPKLAHMFKKQYRRCAQECWQSLGNPVAIVWQYGGNRAFFLAIGILVHFGPMKTYVFSTIPVTLKSAQLVLCIILKAKNVISSSFCCSGQMLHLTVSILEFYRAPCL